MALQSASRPGDIPKDAVLLSEIEAVNYMSEKIFSCRPKREVWSYRYGIPVLGFIAALSAGAINRHFRIKLKLRHYGILSTQFTMILSPVVFAVVPHYAFITADIVLKKTKCHVCVENKAMLIQVVAAVFYPCILAPVVNFMVALKHGTYPVPQWNDYRANFRLIGGFFKLFKHKMLGLIAINAFYTGFLTYSEIAQLKKLEMKLIEQDKMRLNDISNSEIEKCE